MATTRTEATPWMVVNLLTNDIVGYYATDTEAWLNHANEPVDVMWRPKRVRKAGRKFP